MYLNTCFQFLNNITHISTYFFIHMYFQKNWKLLFKYTYQMGSKHYALRRLTNRIIGAFGYLFFCWKMKTKTENNKNNNKKLTVHAESIVYLP